MHSEIGDFCLKNGFVF